LESKLSNAGSSAEKRGFRLTHAASRRAGLTGGFQISAWNSVNFQVFHLLSSIDIFLRQLLYRHIGILSKGVRGANASGQLRKRSPANCGTGFCGADPPAYAALADAGRCRQAQPLHSLRDHLNVYTSITDFRMEI
jgi:hypothetical protein